MVISIEGKRVPNSNPERRRRRRVEAATVITRDELVSGAFKQFDRKLSANGGSLPTWELRDFIRERVSGIRLNGVDIISVDIGNHTKDPIDPMTRAYLESAITKAVVVEYFEPELRRNGVYAVIHPIKSARNYGRSLVHKPEIPYEYNNAFWDQ